MSEQRSVEISGESIEEAIQKGLVELEVSRTDVAIDIIEEGSMGVLGIGKKDAVVRISTLGDPVVEKVAAAPVVAEASSVEDEVADAVAELAGNSADSSSLAEIDFEPELEHEAEVALEIVNNLVTKMGYTANVRADIAERDDMGQRIVIVNVDGDDVESLIGDHGEVLNKLQFIARSMASQVVNDRTTFVIDVANYRQKRQNELVEIAQETAARAAEHKRPIALAPMPPHERRIIHMTLREDERVTTESKGEGDRRRVRIMPKGMRSRPSSGGRGGGYRGGGNRRDGRGNRNRY